MLFFTNLTLKRGLTTLLENANATINPGQKVGLVGKNGCGKSSLFALLKNEMSAEGGEVSFPSTWALAWVNQETPALDCRAIDYVIQGDREYSRLQQALQQANADNDGNAIATLHNQLDAIDAWTIEARAGELLHGLGFSQAELEQPVKAFSGGWRMRLNLAQALICRSDLLLLDEPTNHLDLDAVIWLERWLKQYPGTLILISHDRDFLDPIVGKILHIEQQKLNEYTGDYSSFELQRATKLAQQNAMYRQQQLKIDHLQRYIDRFKAKATKAVQAQSRMKALAKLARIAPAHLDSEFSFEFYNPDHLPNPLLKLEHADLGYEGKTVLHDITLSLESGARYGLLGVNGSGKSTFIKALAGKIDLLSGSIVRSEKLNIGYFAQHQLDTIRADQSPVWHIQQLSPEVREQEIRNFLGGFNFVGDMALQKTEPFSGGEKARLALAMIIWQKPNLLLLDEPTNHLDLDMRHALTLALQSFQGALIVVSHDRSLLEATTDSFLLIDKGRLKNFDGDLNDYRQWRLAQENATAAPAASAQSQNRKDTKRIEAQIRQEKARRGKPIQQKIDKAEKEMAQLSEIQMACETFLAQEEAYSDENKTKLQQTLAQLTEIKVKLTQIEENWLLWQEELEQILTEIDAEFTQL